MNAPRYLLRSHAIKYLIYAVSISFCIQAIAQANAPGSPRLHRNGQWVQLYVDDKPFIVTGGELGNSTASSLTYLSPIWPKLRQMHLNTVFAPVYWELLEPEEGKYDFTLVDGLLQGARKNNLKLVLLWFGTWKNSMSCYVPEWMKTKQERFPRTQNSEGKSEEIITPFSKNALEADRRAFVKLMQHIRQVDESQKTVLMVQVENEIGMLPDARDHSPLANAVFDKVIPPELITYLQIHKETLMPELKKMWEDNGSKISGSWEEVFGKSLATDELFMAWYFGVYVNEIAKAGKEVYNIPMYVNAALNRPGKKPGEYPSAGPLPHVMDIWKAAAPSIDFLSPDFYNPDFKHWSDLYTKNSNPLFIPEHRFEEGVDAKALYAIGHYKTIGFSPFSIESTKKPKEEPIGKAYDIIHQLSGELEKANEKDFEGVLLTRDEDTVVLELGNYVLTVAHPYNLSWAPKAEEWPMTGAIIIAISPDEFYVGGTGVVITFKSKNGMQAGILRVDEGKFVNAVWKPGRRMNGDEDHQGRHLRIDANSYAIQRIKLYQYQ